MLWPRLGMFALVLAMGLALTYALTELSPRRYVAHGGVLLPGGMLKVQYAAADPRAASAFVEGFIAQHKDALLVDRPLVVPLAPPLAQNLALAVVAISIFGLFLLPRRTRPALRSEKELIAVLGEPLLAARPLAAQGLSQQLLAHWFGQGRRLLAVVSPENGASRARVAAELARAFARSGEPTLLIDADLRSPRLHGEFGLRNRAGLADFLEGRAVQLANCADNLAVLVAGRSSADPLELLSRSRLQHLLAAAAKRYRVVLVDTPAAVRGPDLQLFAAFAGGALVVSQFSTEIPALERLRDFLAHCKARVVGTVVSPAVASH